MIWSWKKKFPLPSPGFIIWIFWNFLKNVEVPFNIQNHREHSFYINYIIITHNFYQSMLYMPSRPILAKKCLKGHSGGTFGKSLFFPFSFSIFDKKGILYRMMYIFLIWIWRGAIPLIIWFEKHNLWLCQAGLQSLCFICHII